MLQASGDSIQRPEVRGRAGCVWGAAMGLGEGKKVSGGGRLLERPDETLGIWFG